MRSTTQICLEVLNHPVTHAAVTTLGGGLSSEFATMAGGAILSKTTSTLNSFVGGVITGAVVATANYVHEKCSSKPPLLQADLENQNGNANPNNANTQSSCFGFFKKAAIGLTSMTAFNVLSGMMGQVIFRPENISYATSALTSLVGSPVVFGSAVAVLGLFYCVKSSYVQEKVMDCLERLDSLACCDMDPVTADNSYRAT